MCPIWPLHFIILYLLVLAPLWVLCQAVPNLTAKYTPSDFRVLMDDVAYLNVTIEGDMQYDDRFSVDVSDAHIASASWVSEHVVPADTGLWHGELEVKGNFIGRTDLRVEVSRAGAESRGVAGGAHPVVVVRPERVIDRVFIVSVAVFVSLIFINFGCAMHWPTVKDVIKRPVGPAIGLAGQFIFMPLMSFALGLAIFPDSGTMRLGMFFTGVSPGGGASNIWTFILGGNLNLSLAMTSISTLASFALMPAWLFSLGQVVFREAEIVVPYARISQLVVGLFVPLFIGLCLQKWTPKLAAFMVRILKGFSSLLLLFIIVFAIVTNLYIFELFTWRIVVAGMGIPWLGYAAGYAAARALRQPHADALAISIETGLQNTGIAIFLLGYALHQPEADLTTVIPVSVAIMTPVPMIMIYIGQKIWSCVCPDGSKAWSTATCQGKSWEKTSKSAQSPNSRASQPLMPDTITTSETA